jgi:hypothetical protein
MAGIRLMDKWLTMLAPSREQCTLFVPCSQYVPAPSYAESHSILNSFNEEAPARRVWHKVVWVGLCRPDLRDVIAASSKQRGDNESWSHDVDRRPHSAAVSSFDFGRVLIGSERVTTTQTLTVEGRNRKAVRALVAELQSATIENA